MKKLFKYKESETVELKRSLGEREEILETISAFSNARGGTIYVGVDPSQEIVGVEIGKRTIENLANEIKQNMDPKVFPSIQHEPEGGKEIIKIIVEEYPTKPVWVHDKVFIRVGRTNQRASAEKIRQLIHATHPSLWDSQTVTSAKLSEIDPRRVRHFLNKAEEERNTVFEGSKNLGYVLSKLHLLKDGKLTRAAFLLFGKDAQARVIQAKVRCARFNGTEPIDFADMKVIEGTIIEQVPEALSFIRRHINVAAKITGEPAREEIWEYPREALREAIINAICHRNYEDPGNVQIRIFDDRLQVWSPGTLLPGITPRSLKKEHESKPRNGLIADSFYLIKYIEQWGTGTNRIINLCKKAGLPSPEFTEKAGCFVVTFKRKGFEGKRSLIAPKLNKTQTKIIEYLRKHGRAKTNDLVQATGISRISIRKNLSRMTSLVMWTGKSSTDPHGKYVLK